MCHIWMVKRPYEGNCHIKDWQRVQDTNRSGPAGLRARRRSASVDVRKPLLEMHGHRRARRAIGPCRSVALGTAGRAFNKVQFSDFPTEIRAAAAAPFDRSRTRHGPPPPLSTAAELLDDGRQLRAEHRVTELPRNFTK